MSAKPIPFRHEDNPCYPLPPDYDDLTSEGQRLARVNACRQWTLWNNKIHPIEKGEAFVRGIDFFDKYYLQQDHDDEGNVLFDSYFYDFDPLRTPVEHWEFMRASITNKRLAGVMPRGGAKTSMQRKRIIMQMIARPRYSFIYATSTNELAELTGEMVRYQLYENPRINDDWSPEYGGRIKPGRSEGSQGMKNFVLSNRSSFFATSAESRQRGGRPIRYLLDDPEYDPKASTSMEVIREWMETLIFKIIMPMLSRPNVGIDWVGTFVSKRHYLWHALQTKETTLSDGTLARVADDSRFNKWHRRIARAANEEIDEKGNKVLVSFWPEMWPSTEEEKLRLKLHEDTETLVQIKENWGSAVFNAEMMAQPGEAGTNFFPELDKRLHGWWIDEGSADEAFALKPYKSKSILCYYDGNTDTLIERTIEDMVFTCFMFQTADTSYGEKKTSDFKACGLFLVDENGNLLIMDLWAAQAKEAILVTELFGMADRWRCPLICPEKVKEGSSLIDSISEIVRVRASDAMGVEWLPTIVPKHPGMAEKSARIAGSLWRFEHGKIKMPLWKRDVWPWSTFYDQIEGFNPYVKDGGLEHDDLIDIALAMPQAVTRAGMFVRIGDDEVEKTPYERLMDGETIDHKTGMSLMHMAVSLGMSKAELDTLVDRRMGWDGEEPPMRARRQHTAI